MRFESRYIAIFLSILALTCVFGPATANTFKSGNNTDNAKSAQGGVAAHWEGLLKSAIQFEIEGRDQEAKSKYSEALDSAKESNDNKGKIACLTALADYLDSHGDKEEQAGLRKEALCLAESQFGKQSPQYAEQLAKTALYLAGKGESGNARDNVEQATEILAKNENKFPSEMAACYLATARRQIAEGTYGLADDSYQKALALQDSLPNSSASALRICKDYSVLLEQLGRKAEAAKLKERLSQARIAASIKSASTAGSAVPGAKNTVTAAIESALAADKSADKEQSRTLWKLAVQEAEKKPGADNLLAFALVHLGDGFLAEKQISEALLVYKRALELREKSGDNSSLGLARNLKRIASCYAMQGKQSDATPLLKRALEIEQKNGASENLIAVTLQSLISSTMSSKDTKGAEEAATQLLAVSAKQSGAGAAMSKRMATGMLGGIYIQTGRMNEGMRLMKELSGSASQQQSAAEITKEYQATYNENERMVDQSEFKSAK